MIPELSPLKIVDFAILSSKHSFIPGIAGNEELEKCFGEYDIDIDFSISEDSQNPDVIRFFIKLGINDVIEKKPGYSIFVEGVGIFRIDKKVREKLNQEDLYSLTVRSPFSITLNSLRSYISTITGVSPIGRYILPSIDVGSLFTEKSNQLKERKQKKENKASSKKKSITTEAPKKPKKEK